MTKTDAKKLIMVVSALIVFFGILLAIEPFALNYPKGSGLTTVNAALGMLIATLAACRGLMAYDARSMSLLNMALGLITVLSPWWMQAIYVPAFLTTHLICGCAVIVLETINLGVSQKYRPMGHAW